ncbi:MAG: prepilin peptidase [Syntrophothermus sp.]|uniref:prepilin peptidase n=1 Tax=Syntrophothermus sp. TaxID=2736299 RepID=UPI002579AC2D|nr:A24 family peptidase [Syntrophothermus sp.]NSW84211.1 prepilin peptidase [Syntrophothermus sp.]
MGVFLAFVFGLFVGSFLNVVIYRLPRGESIAAPRSRCPFCRTQLTWRDLVPVFSYLVLGGRCRYCRRPISLRYPAIELLTAVVFAVLWCRFSSPPVFAKYAFFAGLLIAAGAIDAVHYIIPDKLVLAGLAGAVILGFAARDVGIWSALAGCAAGAGFLLLVVVISKGGMGGGDVKLAAVTGLFLGWPLGPLGIFLGACVGGLVAFFLLLFRIKGRKDPLPFGPFIALGSFLALLWGKVLIFWYLGRFW